MITTERWRALKWFADHAVDINAVMGQRMPSTKMRNLMVREGELAREPTGGFAHHRFNLTEAGHELLGRKHKRKWRASDENTEGR